MKVVGLKRISGTFNDQPYDNYNIYALPDRNENVLFGVCPQVIKVKAKVLLEDFPVVESLENQDIECFYDSYKNVVKVNLKG